MKNNDLGSILTYKYSGGFNNKDPKMSIGGEISNTIVNIYKQNIFNNVNESDQASGIIDYRCVYLENLSNKKAYNLSLQLDDVFQGAIFSMGFNMQNEIQTITITGGDFVNGQTITFSYKEKNFIVKYNTNINIFKTNFQKSINKIYSLKDVTIDGNYANGNSVITVNFQGLSGNKYQPLLKIESYTLTPDPVITILRKQAGSPINLIQEKLNNSLQSPYKINFLELTSKIEFNVLEKGDFLPIWLRRQVFSSTIPIENDGCSIITKALIQLKG